MEKKLFSAIQWLVVDAHTCLRDCVVVRFIEMQFSFIFSSLIFILEFNFALRKFIANWILSFKTIDKFFFLKILISFEICLRKICFFCWQKLKIEQREFTVHRNLFAVPNFATYVLERSRSSIFFLPFFHSLSLGHSFHPVKNCGQFYQKSWELLFWSGRKNADLNKFRIFSIALHKWRHISLQFSFHPRSFKGFCKKYAFETYLSIRFDYTLLLQSRSYVQRKSLSYFHQTNIVRNQFKINLIKKFVKI